jgi:hypothetical protein
MIKSLTKRGRRLGRSKDRDAPSGDRPVLFVDVDGVLSLFDPDGREDMPGPFHWIDGVAHCIPPDSGPLLERLARHFELVWASGWEGLANEYLPGILKLSIPAPNHLSFDGRASFGTTFWKVEAMDEYAGSRPAAWIDDNIDAAGRRWAEWRDAPTLLVEATPSIGITRAHTEQLVRWAKLVAVSAKKPN